MGVVQLVAYLRVHSRAVASYFDLSTLNNCAASGTSGSSGLGSVSNEQMERSTLEIVSAGDQFSLKMSRQMLPFEFIFG